MGNLDKAIKSREAEFCNFYPAKVLVCSWNVNATKPQDIPENELIIWFSQSDTPDIIAVGLQEIIDLESKTKNASEFPLLFLHSLEILSLFFFLKKT